MDSKFQYGGWAAAVVALLLTVLFGPVFAAYVFVGGAFTIMGVLMGVQAVKAIGEWRLDHPAKPRQTKRA